MCAFVTLLLFMDSLIYTIVERENLHVQSYNIIVYKFFTLCLEMLAQNSSVHCKINAHSEQFCLYKLNKMEQINFYSLLIEDEVCNMIYLALYGHRNHRSKFVKQFEKFLDCIYREIQCFLDNYWSLIKITVCTIYVVSSYCTINQ